MPTSYHCAKCGSEAQDTYTVGFYRDDNKATDKLCTNCFGSICADWETKPDFIRK